MTLREAINQGIIPSFGDDNENLINYEIFFKQLFIDSKDFSLDINIKDEDLRKLRYNSDINYKYVNNVANNANNALIQKYKDLIDKYKEISAGMVEDYLSDAKEEIDNIIKDLEARLKVIEGNIHFFDIESKNLGYDENVISRHDQNVLNRSNVKIDSLSDKLDKKYKKLNKLEEKAEKHKLEFLKNAKKKRIEKVKNRISKLQQKQGILQSRQQRIISKGVTEYVNIKTNELNSYVPSLEQEETYANAKRNINKQIEEAEEKIQLNQKDINILNSKTGLYNKFSKVGLQMKQNKQRLNIKVLRTKEEILDKLRKMSKGSVVFSNQIYKYVSNKYAHEM